jgi:hypothetical protein
MTLAKIVTGKKCLTANLIYINRSFPLLRLFSTRSASPANPSGTTVKPGFGGGGMHFYHAFCTSKPFKFVTIISHFIINRDFQLPRLFSARLASHTSCMVDKPGIGGG